MWNKRKQSLPIASILKEVEPSKEEIGRVRTLTELLKSRKRETKLECTVRMNNFYTKKATDDREKLKMVDNFYSCKKSGSPQMMQWPTYSTVAKHNEADRLHARSMNGLLESF